MVQPEIVPVPDNGVWAREPAKVVGWIVSGALLLASLVTFVLSPDVIAVLPHGWAVPIRLITVTAAAVTLIGGRAQTWLTRNGLGPVGNGKDGVYSPAKVAEIAAVATAAARRGGDGTGLPPAP